MPSFLDEKSQLALRSKINIRSATIAVSSVSSADTLLDLNTRAFLGASYDSYRIGEFISLEEIRLRWVKSDWFELIPSSVAPFSFRRSSQQTIIPKRMFTDGGSIPRPLWLAEDLSPWSYGPAFLIHDWLFDLHHSGNDEYKFEDARDTMMEGVKTLMESGICAKSLTIFHGLYLGIDSIFARNLWETQPPSKTLPP